MLIDNSDNSSKSSVELRIELSSSSNIAWPGPFLALCRSCFWTASIFGTEASASNFSSCPVCLNKEMAFIPLVGFGSLQQHEKKSNDTVRSTISSKQEEEDKTKSQHI